MAASLALVDTAGASRRPTLHEREAVTNALPAFVRRIPTVCVWLDISVSANGRFARVRSLYLNATRAACLRYAADGLWILRETSRWSVVFTGSDLPSCRLGVPRDLTACST